MMQDDKKSIRLVRKLVELSKDGEGVVTEARVCEVIAGLKKIQGCSCRQLLKAYRKGISRELAAQTAIVAAPGPLGEEALKAIETNFTAFYGRRIQTVIKSDPSLIAGVRVRVGDDLYDASVAGFLESFARQVH